MMKKLLMIAVLLGLAAALGGPLQAASDITSVNFYMYPWPWTTSDQFETITLEPGQSAGFDEWLTDSWLNYEVPWDPAAPQPPVTLTSTQGSTATFILVTCRNGGGFYWDSPRTTLLGDGNADMMDGHVNSTEDSGEFFEMVVSDITLETYDVIIYMGANDAQFGDGTGKIVFNGGPEQDFTIIRGFDGTFTEIVNGVTPGNYIEYKGVTGSSFTVQVWGNGFNHIGPYGFQFGVKDLGAPSVNAGSDWITWSGEAVTLNDVLVTDNDPGAGALTMAWSAVPDTGVVFDPNEFVEAPTITITKETDNPSAVTLTLTVAQPGKDPVESSMTIDVYDDACKAALGAGTATIAPADFNANCSTGLEDIAQLAVEWLVDFSLVEPVAK